METSRKGSLIACLAILFFSLSVHAKDKDKEIDPFSETEALDKEQDFPDLVHADESGAIIDEFALLEEEITADEVESASRHRQSIFWSPSAINVYTREDIRASGAANLPDFLRRVPGFDVMEVKPAYTVVGARALTNEYNNQVLLLVDGREEMVELTGFPFWNALSFDLQQVERIEVIRGPGSTLYGANAFAAVVSVVTVPDRPENGVDLYLDGGERLHQQGFVRLRGSTDLAGGALTWGLSGSMSRDRNPSEYRFDGLWGVRSHNFVRYRKENLDLSLQGGVALGHGNVYLFMGDIRISGVFDPWAMGKASYNLSDRMRIKAQLYFNQYSGDIHFRSRLRGYGVWIANLPDIPWDSDTLDGQITFDWLALEELQFICGGNLRYSTLSGEKLIMEDDDDLRGALFAHLQWQPLGWLQATAGIRLDVDEITGAMPSPRLVAVFRPWPRQSFRLGYALAFRKPSFFESRLHLQVEEYNQAMPEIVDVMATGMASSELENVKVHSLEAGWQGRFFDENLQLRLDLFANRYRDNIGFMAEVPLRMGLPDIPQSTIRFQNGVYDMDVLGGEAEVIWRLARGFQAWGNLGLRFAYLESTGERTGLEPTTRIGLGARYLPPGGWVVDLAAHYVSQFKKHLVRAYNLMKPGFYPEVGDAWLLIGRLGYRTAGSGYQAETGLTVRTPLGPPHREFPGYPLERAYPLDNLADYGGEFLVRRFSVYLRGSF